MNRKVKLIIIISVLLMLLIIFIILIRKTKVTNNYQGDNPQEDINASSIILDDKTGEYVIYNKENGEEIARGKNESDLYIYEVDPTYNPKMLISGEIYEADLEE